MKLLLVFSAFVCYISKFQPVTMLYKFSFNGNSLHRILWGLWRGNSGGRPLSDRSALLMGRRWLPWQVKRHWPRCQHCWLWLFWFGPVRRLQRHWQDYCQNCCHSIRGHALQAHSIRWTRPWWPSLLQWRWIHSPCWHYVWQRHVRSSTAHWRPRTRRTGHCDRQNDNRSAVLLIVAPCKA